MSVLAGYITVLLIVVPAISILIATLAQLSQIFYIAVIAVAAGRREGWGKAKLLL